MVPNGNPEFPGKSWKPPLERPRNGTTPQVAPKTTQGPPLDPHWTPKCPQGAPKDAPKTSKRPPKDPQRAPQDPQSAPKAPPKEPQRIPKKDLQIGSLFHAFLDALDLHFQCCASALTQPTSDHTTLQVVSKKTLKQYDNSSSPQKLQCRNRAWYDAANIRNSPQQVLPK